MARNVEIKAHARDWPAQLARARALAASVEELAQEDTFFACPTGRLKLRQLGTGDAQLILYRRPDRAGPKTSDFEIVEVTDAASLRRLLTSAFGERGSVRKRRTVLHVGRTRVHFDEVDGLGRFIELEVVLRPDESPEAGEATARDLMAALDIRSADLIEGAYVDLLPAPGKPPGAPEPG